LLDFGRTLQFTNNDGSESERFKNKPIRIHNTAFQTVGKTNYQHLSLSSSWFILKKEEARENSRQQSKKLKVN
jgi:hypothetical protein